MTEKTYKRFLVSLDETLLKKLDFTADELGLTRTQMVRKMIREWSEDVDERAARMRA